MYVLKAVSFFFPYFVSALLLAVIMGALLQAQFAEASAKGFTLIGISRATAFFAMFAIFGLVVAYFLSLGLKEDQNDLSNSLIEQFATPLIALLTAGVSYYAKQQAPQVAVTAGEPSKSLSALVAAGVTCFLIESSLCYRALYLDAINR